MYEEAKEQARKLYQSIRYVHSHALNEPVYFTAAGFNHMVFKTPQAERDRLSQVLRFKLLSRAIKLVGISTTYQEYEKKFRRFEIKMNKDRISKDKVTRYWGIIGIVDEVKIKVVLRKVGSDGELHFWSVIPGWTTGRRRDERFALTMKGNPDED